MNIALVRRGARRKHHAARTLILDPLQLNELGGRLPYCFLEIDASPMNHAWRIATKNPYAI